MARALCSLLLLLYAAAAHADDEMRAKALDLVYEAADAIDQAKAFLDEDNEREAERLLTRAEEYLKRAQALDGGLARIPFERARLQKLDGAPDLALGTLHTALRGELSLEDHLRGVKILDELRADLEKPPIAAEWRQRVTLRNVGGGALAGGMIASAVGLGLAFSSFAQGAYHGVTDLDLFANRFGWGLGFVGMAVSAAGGAVMIVTTVQVDELKSILPGPWRMEGGRPSGRGARAQTAAPPFSVMLALRWPPPAQDRVRVDW
jgi:hypothetical protein